jgi:hypothetical protein
MYLLCTEGCGVMITVQRQAKLYIELHLESGHAVSLWLRHYATNQKVAG